jgi:hypothetical protein
VTDAEMIRQPAAGDILAEELEALGVTERSQP